MRIWQHDTLPDIEHTLYTTVDGVVSATNLTSGVTSIRAIARQNGAELFDRTVTGDSSGVITHQWQSGDTDTVGTIAGEYEVTFATGRKLTYPWSDSYDVAADLSGD